MEVQAMTAMVDLRKSDDPSDAIHRAVSLLVAGHLVAFPTETVYAACAHSLSPSAVGKLTSLQAQLRDAHPTMVVKGIQEAIDFVPSMDRLGQRLARRCWPGPVILAFDVPSELGLFHELPPESQRALSPDGRVWLRVPAHECVQEALRLMPAPLVAACERGKQGDPPITAKKLVASFGDHVDLVIDDGECRYSEPATVVHVGNGSWSILREGVVTKTLIGRLASEVFLFICTGNTCRSPLAEGFFRKMLAERLRCAEDELSDRGFMVLSAGLAADTGLPASVESVEVARRYGVDLRSHESQPVSDRLLEQADRILTMTRAHKEAILASHPHLANRVELLARDNTDITDPIGAGEQEYEICRGEIERNLRAILDALPSEGAV
jgi:L-threonylcarbamoyladenylate synthase